MDVQLISYDAAQCVPTPLDKNFVTFNGVMSGSCKLNLKTVPTIRLYVRAGGVSSLVHVHNVFPYLYVPVEAERFPNAEVELVRWLNEINNQLALSYSKKQRPRRKVEGIRKKRQKRGKVDQNEHHDYEYNDQDQESEFDTDEEVDTNSEVLSTSNSYVADISIVSGVPFYGYHLSSSTFLKISMASPKYTVRLSKLMTESKLFKRFYQPYESHIPYTLQFLADYNLYTLKSIRFNKFLWRSPIILLDNVSQDYQPFFETHFVDFNKMRLNNTVEEFVNGHICIDNNGNLNVLEQSKFPRSARSLLEFDAQASWIDNINDLVDRTPATLHSGESFSADLSYISSTKSLLDDVDNLRRSKGLDVGVSQHGLFDNIKRSCSGSLWNDQEDIKVMFRTAVKLSEDAFVKKYKTKDINLLKKWSGKKAAFPTPFQSVKSLQYEPIIGSSCLVDSKVLAMSPNNYLSALLAFASRKGTLLKSSSDGIVNTNLPCALEIEQDLIDAISEDSEKTDDDNPPKEGDDTTVINHHDGLFPNEHSNNSFNLTLKLQESSVIEEVTTSNISGSAKPYRSSFILSQRIPQFFKFVSYFGDIFDEKLFSFNVQQPMSCSKDKFLNELETFGLPKIDYMDPFFSKLSNFDSRPFIFAGEKFVLKCKEIDKDLYPGLDQFNFFQQPANKNSPNLWKYSPIPPSFTDVKQWSQVPEQSKENAGFNYDSQIRGPTQKFKEYKYPSLKTPVERLSVENISLSILIMEIHVNTRGKYYPDPKLDEINAVFYHTNLPTNVSALHNVGVFVNTSSGDARKYKQFANESNFSLTCFQNELDLLVALVSLVEYLDPDILSGYELHALSWGYVIERSKAKYNIDLCQRFSRVVHKQANKVGDRWGYTHASGIKITGRQMFNLWRRLRSVLNLNHYTLENVVFHVLHDRLPAYKMETLSKWLKKDFKGTSYVINYYVSKIKYEMLLIQKLELVEKINEESQLLGIDFYSILYRGSQYKVECLLVRLAKSENFLLVSPSKKQVFKQDSLECIPLVMEPNSSFYKSPLIVLDFQSLYPSLIIAYNICYSTALGRLKDYDPQKYTRLGVINYKSPEGLLKLLENNINISPNGVVFAKEDIRKSLLAKLLLEILNTRIYIKDTMSNFKDDQELKTLYGNRQLALKLIANVTYGYTSASYSGRMPNSDIADAIVSYGRETLLKAVKEIESHDFWGAKVVYGDTDSLFVYLPGKTKSDAFRIGKEMADYITKLNPAPVKLKFEKVYLPSILVSKKRYVGWCSEYEDQSPRFEAKGIETVRRDGIPAQQKILEKAIILLFKSKDVSQVKEYVLDQFVKITQNKVNLKDFMFAKEVRIGTYKNEKYIPAGARLAMRSIEKDHRAEPQYKERVYYLVRRGHNKEILRDRCVSPDQFLSDLNMVLDSEYYINKVLVPPLERVFNLLGVDIKSWVKEVPQKISYAGIDSTLLNVKVRSCLCCKGIAADGLLCTECLQNSLGTMLKLKSEACDKAVKTRNYVDFCRFCSSNVLNEDVSSTTANECCNEDCSIYYSRTKKLRETRTASANYRAIPDW